MPSQDRSRPRLTRPRDVSGCAVITGASSGIGAATAVALARSGMSVVAVARSASHLFERKSAPDLEEHLEPIDADMTDPAEVERVFAVAEDRWGPIRISVASVGYAYDVGWFVESDSDSIRAAVESLILSPALVLHRAIRSMESTGGGAAALVSSGAAEKPTPGRALYGPSKAAVSALVASVAVECASRESNVGVFGISPGRVDTPAQRKLIESAQTAPAGFGLESFKSTVGVAAADEVGSAIATLAQRHPSELNGGLFRYRGKGWERLD